MRERERAVCGLCWKSDGCGFPLQRKLETRPLKCVYMCVRVCVCVLTSVCMRDSDRKHIHPAVFKNIYININISIQVKCFKKLKK